MSEPIGTYGLMAEFDSPDALRHAVESVRERGFEKVEAFSPYPVEGIASRLDHKRDWLALWTLLGGIAAAGISYFIQFYAATIDYPLNIGGRPLNSWPAFIPISIEFTLFGAAFGAAVALLVSDRLPKLYHPVFNVPRFEHASRDAFFLCLRAEDPRFDRDGNRALLQELGARDIFEVPL